ncbi:MAG: hypothetical protein CMB37_00940 [Euryarchaeota archaeon]|nr:hypothetical protein [Euryarchaeota archaeon]
MGDCEICGAMRVGTRSVVQGRSPIEACKRCIERMGLDTSSPVNTKSPQKSSRVGGTSGGYGGIGQKGKDIMMRNATQLRDDFGPAVRQARENNGWEQRELAKRMAERVNVIQSTESGKRPTDAVIKKFERILGIKLMVLREDSGETKVASSSSRGLTMADLYDEAMKEFRGD